MLLVGSGVHILGETKVYNPIVTNPTKLRRASVYAFGATEHELRVKILGARADPSSGGGTSAPAKYQAALDGGHRVVPLIHEVFGGLASDADAFLSELGRLRSQALGADSSHATWAARTFVPFWRQRVSVAVHMGVALELARVVSQGEEHVRALATKRAPRPTASAPAGDD